MRRHAFAASLLALSLALAGAAVAQTPSPAQQAAQMQAAQDAATAAAIHPGDEAMTCDALQAEMTANMQDPAMQANIAALGQWSQEQQQRAQDARSRAMAQAAPNIVAGIASSFIPGMGYAQMAMQQAQMAQMQRDAAQAQQSNVQMEGYMQGMMPQMMRGQRLYELAQAKQCAFLQQQAPAPGDAQTAPPQH